MKKPIIERLNIAREQLGAGKGITGLEQLLVDASMHLMSKDDVVEERRLETAKDYWRLYSEYTTRLTTLGHEIIKAGEPRAEQVRLVKWYTIGGGRNEQPERLSLEFDYRIYEEDWRDEERFTDVQDSRGGTYAVAKRQMYVEQSWLTLSDAEIAKKVELEKMRQDLHLAEIHQEDRPKKLREAQERVEKIIDTERAEAARIADLKQKIEAAEKADV